MTQTTPRISIITATWNSVSTLSDCLNSLTEQTYMNREHLIIDGGSTDGTLRILSDRRAQIDYLVSEPDKGIYDALNKGIRAATGDVVGFLHSDDRYESKQTLERIAAAFHNPAVSAVYGDLKYVRRDDEQSVLRNWVAGEFNPRRLKRGWMPPHPTLYVRKAWYERIGGFDTRYRISADYASILQLFSQPDFDAVYVPETLVKMRWGGASNKSLKNIFRKSHEDYDALKRSGVGGVGALILKNLSKIAQFRVARTGSD